MNASATAIGPLEKSIWNASNKEIGGKIAPTIIEIINTLITLLPSIMPIDEGIIKYANVKTSPTNSGYCFSIWLLELAYL